MANRRFSKKILMGVIALLFLGIQLIAATANAGDGDVKYWAVICGIADYQSINDLNYTDDDAVDMNAALLGYSEWSGNAQIEVLIDSEASKAGIKDAIRRMGEKADENDICLFFFSGHGTQVGDSDGDETTDNVDEAICAWDTYTQRVRRYVYIYNVITDDELGSWFAQYLPAGADVVAIFDTCFAGGLAKEVEGLGIKSFRNPGIRKGAKVKRHFGKGLAERLAKRGQAAKDDIPTGEVTAKDIGGESVVLMACEEGRYSYENSDLQNGFFGYYVTEGIELPADINEDGILSAEDVFCYADPLVTAYAASVGVTQNPQLYDGNGGDELGIATLMVPLNVDVEFEAVTGITVTVTDSEGVVEHASVNLETTITDTEALTGDEGQAGFPLPFKATYTVTATATKEGYAQGSGSTIFTVE